MFKLNLSSTNKIPLKRALAIILGLIVMGELATLASNNLSKAKSLDRYAKDIIRKCSAIEYRPACYDKEIPKTMNHVSMEDAFNITRIVQGEDQTYQYCHVLGHDLSAREVDKDPSKWEEIITRCPPGMCSNGCLHGGFQERFRTESFSDQSQIDAIKNDLRIVCEPRKNWNPTGLEQGSCYHALGHLTMYITAADINKSIGLCREIAPSNFLQLCYDGAFMQIYQPLEPEDFALIKGKEIKKGQVAPFCAKFEKNPRASCLTESWPLFFAQLSEPKGLDQFCAMADEDFRQRCYSAEIYVMTAQFNFDTAKMKNYCSKINAQRVGLCFANASSRLIETDYRNIDKSVDLCISPKKESDQAQCFKELLTYSTFNFHFGSDEFLKLCNAMPDPWKKECLNPQTSQI